MKTVVPGASASALIDGKIRELGDWRGDMLARVREIAREADPEIVEEWKWRGTPVWWHAGIVCTGETYKSVVKMTFAKGAALQDPSGLFNSSLDGNVRRAIDIHEGDKVDAEALKDLLRAAVALNLGARASQDPGERANRRPNSARGLYSLRQLQGPHEGRSLWICLVILGSGLARGRRVVTYVERLELSARGLDEELQRDGPLGSLEVW